MLTDARGWRPLPALFDFRRGEDWLPVDHKLEDVQDGPETEMEEIRTELRVLIGRLGRVIARDQGSR